MMQLQKESVNMSDKLLKCGHYDYGQAEGETCFWCLHIAKSDDLPMAHFIKQVIASIAIWGVIILAIIGGYELLIRMFE